MIRLQVSHEENYVFWMLKWEMSVKMLVIVGALPVSYLFREFVF